MKQYEKWMPLYIADYLADTSRLTLEQHGAYLLLIMDYWRNGPPPDEPAILARIVGASDPQWKAIAPTIRKLFQQENGLWRHKRIDFEIERAKTIQANLSERGKLGANTRWNKDTTSNATGNQQAMPNTMLADAPSPSPLPIPKTPLPKSKSTASSGKDIYERAEVLGLKRSVGEPMTMFVLRVASAEARSQ